MRGRLLLALALLLTNGCANCGEKDEPEAAPGKPEPPVVTHSKLKDGGVGPAKIVDLSERKSPFASDASEPAEAP